jgi:hypothetical protein
MLCVSTIWLLPVGVVEVVLLVVARVLVVY